VPDFSHVTVGSIPAASTNPLMDKGPSQEGPFFLDGESLLRCSIGFWPAILRHAPLAEFG
jgi:hypothetical protein